MAEGHRGSEADQSAPARRDVLKRFFALKAGEQLEIYSEIREALAERGPAANELDTEIERRRRTLAALTAVAGELRRRGELADDAAPTTRQYNDVAPELGIDISSAQVIRAWGLWRHAQLALTGEEVPEGAVRRKIRADSSRAALDEEHHLRGVREWLETEPPSRAVSAYGAFATSHNQTSRGTGDRLPTANAITTGLRLSWSFVIAVASDEMDLEEARRADIAEQTEGLDEDSLVGAGLVATMSGYRSQRLDHGVRAGKFPPPIALISGKRAWRLGDVHAARRGKVRQYPEGEWQDRVLDTKQLAAELGVKQNTLASYIHQELWSYTPEPAGKVGHHHYWWRETVEAWAARRQSV